MGISSSLKPFQPVWSSQSWNLCLYFWSSWVKVIECLVSPESYSSLVCRRSLEWHFLHSRLCVLSRLPYLDSRPLFAASSLPLSLRNFISQQTWSKFSVQHEHLYSTFITLYQDLYLVWQSIVGPVSAIVSILGCLRCVSTGSFLFWDSSCTSLFFCEPGYQHAFKYSPTRLWYG